MSNLSKKFEFYLLEEKGVSKKTIRNYRSDLAEFIRWCNQKLGLKSVDSLQEAVPYFSPSMFASYKGYQLEKQIPHSTLNRKLSTLRNLTGFLQKEGLIKNNPTEFITNISSQTSWQEKLEKIITQFAKDLENEGISKLTLKNYLSDVRHFLNWLTNINQNPKGGW